MKLPAFVLSALIPTVLAAAQGLPPLPHEAEAYGVEAQRIVARLPLWPGLAPHETASGRGRFAYDDKSPPRFRGWRRCGVTAPEVVVLKPEVVSNGTLVLAMPGGGYNSHNMNCLKKAPRALLESGRWVAVLHYRVPRRPDRAIYDAPREDAARAIRLLRARAGEFGYSPDRIGAIGFSAGANLAALAATSSEDSLYARADASDDLPCNLAFAIPVYPAYVLDDGATGPNACGGDGAKVLPCFKFDAKTPPMFMLHGDEDAYSPMASVRLYAELHRRKIPAQLFVFSHADHGLGDCGHVRDWPVQVVAWIAEMGF